MKALHDCMDWIDRRAGLRPALRQRLDHPMPGGARWLGVWPSMIVFTFVIQLITGIFLWMFYSPSAQTAWESVHYLQYEVAGGWLLRGVHHYAAQVLVALLGLYFIQMIFRGTYRAPREMVFWVVVLLGLFSLGSCLTGDLLAWDQNSYASTLVRTKFLMLLPWIGDDLFKLAAGGPAFGHLTLTRFFALHVGLFGSAFFVLLLLCGWLVRRAEAIRPGSWEGTCSLCSLVATLRCQVPPSAEEAEEAEQPEAEQPEAEQPEAEQPEAEQPEAEQPEAEQPEAEQPEVEQPEVEQAGEATPESTDLYWPDQLVRNAVAWLGVMLVIGLLVFWGGFSGDHAGQPAGDYLGVALGAPADPDPANFYGAARPEWSFRGLYEFSNLFPGTVKILPIFIVPGLLVLWVFSMPFIALARRGHLINQSIVGVLLAALIVLSWMSWSHDADSSDHQAALAAGREEAQRVKQLARAKEGIPGAGALSLLRTDPKTRGPKLYEKHCAICHNYGAPEEEAIRAETPSAPDLYGFAGEAWIAGLLDPKQVAGPKYFGNTRFAAGAMVQYVEGPLAKLDAAQRRVIAAALAAEAGTSPAPDEKRQNLIAEGRGLIASEGCTRCHRFGDQGAKGVAPVLTGYGSREWIIGVVADPTHPCFYGTRNDRMPAYVELPEQPAENRLAAAEVDLVARWLQGDWYEPPTDEADDDEAHDDDEDDDEAHDDDDEAHEPGHDGEPAAEPASREPQGPSAVLVLGQWLGRRPETAPPTGPHAEARQLFQAECAMCHACSGAPGGDVPSAFPSAPDLGGFAGEAWIAGLLDPKQVDGPKYFGNSAFADGSMVDFVKGNLKELKDEMEDEFEDMIAALAEEATRSPGPDAQEPDEDTMFLFEDFTCTGCHPFYDAGEDLGAAPDLTRYGSREWLLGILRDPTHERFYGEENDGMPSYRMFPKSPEKNLLTDGQIEVVADWLRAANQAND